MCPIVYVCACTCCMLFANRQVRKEEDVEDVDTFDEIMDIPETISTGKTFDL